MPQPVLIPPRPLPQAPFAPVSVQTGAGYSTTLYHVPDDEIDFATFLKEPLSPALANSAGTKWKAHWLAVEGVQPAVPENPPPISKAGRELTTLPSYPALLPGPTLTDPTPTDISSTQPRPSTDLGRFWLRLQC